MADSPVSPETGASARYPGTPRWVKVSGIVLLILILLVVGVMVAGGGQHGPGRHMPASAPGGTGGAEGHAPPAVAVLQA